MIKTFIINLFISLGLVGGIAAFLTKDAMQIYKYIILPPFAPPSMIFPIVWSILYILMAISATIIYEKSSKILPLVIYAATLFFNFIWPLFFFNGRMFSTSLIVLIILWILVAYMIFEYYKISKLAAYLQIPYLLWLTFAAYLNWNIYILN